MANRLNVQNIYASDSDTTAAVQVNGANVTLNGTANDIGTVTSGTFNATLGSSADFSSIANDAISGYKIHSGIPSNLLSLGFDWDNPWGSGVGSSAGNGSWSTMSYQVRNWASVSGSPTVDLSSGEFPHGLYILNGRVPWDGAGFNFWCFISKLRYANNTQYGSPSSGGGYLMKGAYYEMQLSSNQLQIRYNASWVSANQPNWTMWQLIDYEGV